MLHWSPHLWVCQSVSPAEVPSLRFQASRASGAAWMDTVLQTASLLNDAEILRCLQITLPLQSHDMQTGEPVMLDENDSENKRLEVFWNYLCELCSSRCWSQVQFAMLVPQLLAVVWHESHEVRQEGLQRARAIWGAVLEAENLVYGTEPGDTVSKKTHKTIAKCLGDCAWHCLQLARESYSVCHSCSWNPADEQLRLLTHRLFARPCTTKHFLEDSFNHLADLARRHMKGQTMQRSLGPGQTNQ